MDDYQNQTWLLFYSDIPFCKLRKKSMHPFKSYCGKTISLPCILPQQKKLSRTRQCEGLLYAPPQNDNGAASKFKAQTGGLQFRPWPWVRIVELWVLHIISLRQTFDPNLTRGPRATGRSPEWHSHCRYADVMQHFSNPVIATNEKIII